MSDEPLQSPLEHMLLSWIRGDVVVIGVKIRTAMLPFGGHARRLTAVVGLGRRSEDTGAYYLLFTALLWKKSVPSPIRRAPQ
jgi:hypothetical protein